ncbi:MAG TPA: hypothetical protein VEV81_14035 [Pyrinomonadaceae bacterium]|nr:hypothetical protein [Pyrinomonadaceae bacterium]
MAFKKASRYAPLLLALLLGSTVCASAQRKSVQRIQFPRDRTTAVLKGVLKGDTDMTYVVRARKGQTLIAHLAVENGCCASLMAKGPDNISLTNADGTDAGDDFSVVLKRTGDYRLIVFPPDTADRKDVARYTLEVTIR